MKLDRLTRSVRDLGHLVERYFAPGKAALPSVASRSTPASAAGRLVLNVLASVSQWEREAIGERTATAMQHEASQCKYTGGRAPYGPFKWTKSARQIRERLDRVTAIYDRAH